MKQKILFLLVGLLLSAATGFAQSWTGAFTKSFGNVNQTYDGGDKYKGQTNGRTREGLGVYKWATGSYYFGDWTNGDMNGVAIYIAKSGSQISNCKDCAVFVGSLSYSKKSGKGSCYDKSGDLIYYGNFSGDSPADTYPSSDDYSAYKFQMLTYNGGDQYVGETKNGLWHGRGIYIWANGNMWYGKWVDGKRSGNGIKLADNAAWYEQECSGDDCTTLASYSPSQSSPSSSYVSNNSGNKNSGSSSSGTTVPCGACSATGKLLCNICSGAGSNMMPQVNYYTHSVYYAPMTCTFCGGKGKISCWACSGAGSINTSDIPPAGGDSNYYYDNSCSKCGGTTTCQNCYGSGTKVNPATGNTLQCTYCHGSGKCWLCRGTGRKGGR